MQIHTTTQIQPDGTINLNLLTGLPPGEVNVTVTIPENIGRSENKPRANAPVIHPLEPYDWGPKAEPQEKFIDWEETVKSWGDQPI